MHNFMVTLPFQDRADGGRQIGERLTAYSLWVPGRSCWRSHAAGVPVGAEIAGALNVSSKASRCPISRGRSVILVDDGLALGSSMLAAAKHVRTAEPRELIVAVPVSTVVSFEQVET